MCSVFSLKFQLEKMFIVNGPFFVSADWNAGSEIRRRVATGVTRDVASNLRSPFFGHKTSEVAERRVTRTSFCAVLFAFYSRQFSRILVEFKVNPK